MLTNKDITTLQTISSLVSEKNLTKALNITNKIYTSCSEKALILNVRGFILLQLKRYAEAADDLKGAIMIAQEFFEPYLNLGRVYFEQKKYSQTIEILNKALCLNQNDENVFYLLLRSYFEISLYSEAINLFIKNKKNESVLSKRVLSLLAKVYYETNNLNESEKIYRKLLTLDPKNIEIYKNLATIMFNVNRIDEGKTYLLDAYKIDNANLEILYHLVFYTGYILSENQVSDLSNLKINIKNYYAFFILHKFYEDNADWTKSFYFLNKANKFLSGKYLFREKDYQEKIDLSQKIYKAIDKLETSISNIDYKIIFIVGLPRCGSTMLENVFLSNPEIYSIGESGLFNQFIFNFKNNQKKEDLIKKIDNFRNYYFERVKQFTNKKIIIDKSLNNYMHIGIIEKIFPNAKIINLFRNPLSQAFSCFKTNFFAKQGLSYAHDLKSLLFVFKSYKNSMKYWDDKCLKAMISISYEDLVKDKEENFRKLFDFCDLNFSLKFLDIQNNKNISKTASILQVRQKIVFKRNNIVEMYEPFMCELVENFKNLLD